MGARCASATQLVMGQHHRPPNGQGHHLFVADPSEFGARPYEELVVCPSRTGAHIIQYKDQFVVYKIKVGMVLHGELARFNLYEVDPNGRPSRVALAHLDKARTVLTAKRGSYSMLQAWHLAAYKLEKQERTSLQNRRKSTKTPTVSEVLALNLHLRVTGKKDMTRGRGAERWDAEFAISDSHYKMKADGDGHACSSRIKTVRVYAKDELVCAAHLQGFEHMRRASWERPFMGIQVRGKLARNLMGWDDVSKGQKDDKAQMMGKPEELLPLLLCLAWGEEVVLPPDDHRAEYMQRMRSEDYVDPHSTDIELDTAPTALAAAGASEGGAATAADAQKPAPRAGALDWQMTPPLHPAGSISTHLKNTPSSLKKQNLSELNSISLTGV